MMKTYLAAWWRGIGIFGMFICLSITLGAIGFVIGILPENIQLVIGLPLLLIAGPPLLFWVFRWIYPEATAAKSRFWNGHPK